MAKVGIILTTKRSLWGSDSDPGRYTQNTSRVVFYSRPSIPLFESGQSGNRTHMRLLSHDFESCASTNSAIRPCYIFSQQSLSHKTVWPLAPGFFFRTRQSLHSLAIDPFGHVIYFLGKASTIEMYGFGHLTRRFGGLFYEKILSCILMV